MAQLKKTIHSLPTKIIHAQRLEELSGCQIVFIPAGTSAELLHALLKQAQLLPMMIVGEDPSFAAVGGDAALVVNGSRGQLELNARALTRKTIRPTPQLLKIAKIVQSTDEVSKTASPKPTNTLKPDNRSAIRTSRSAEVMTP